VKLAPAVGARRRDSHHRSATAVAALLVASAAWLAIGGSAVLAAPNSLALRATYKVSAFVHWSEATLDVSSTATVMNTVGGNVKDVTFNLVTLKTGAAHISAVKVDRADASFTATGQTVVVHLPTPLPPGSAANVRIVYTAQFNAAPSGGHRSLFARQDGIAAAYRWIPWLSKQQQFDNTNFGESWVTGVSPRVEVTMNDVAHLVYATNGTRTASRANGQTFLAHNVRDFNFSASPNYQSTKVSHNGVSVRFYSTTALANNVRKWTLAALDRFDSKIGQYPYSKLTVAMTPGGSGMESPGMTWISTAEPAANLAYLAVHEVAHQWFYGAVGNNQATAPFLDEGVADFLTRDTLNSFRNSRCADQPLDKSVYRYSAKCYNEVIYVQSSTYIDAYRNNVGGAKFWTGMSRFYRQNEFKIANTRLFWDTLDQATGYNSRLHADRFPSLYP
jgi:hypothetical protein